MKIFGGLIIVIFAVVTDIACRKHVRLSRRERVIQLEPILQALGLENVTITEQSPNILELIRQRQWTQLPEASLSLCNLSDLIEKYQHWMKFLPRVVPFYAVKSNDDPFILKLLASLGIGFDCASKGEIEKALKVGIHPSRIIYANPTKYEEHIASAKENNVRRTVFDSDYELHKIKKYFPETEILIRIRADAIKSINSFGRKFGCDPRQDGPRLIRLAQELGLKVVGCAFHIGTGANEPEAYERGLHMCKKLFNYAASLGVTLKLVDIGGGFAGDKNYNLNEVAPAINIALEKHFPSKDVIILAEPGRYFSSSAVTLVCRIHSKRKIVIDGKVEKIIYYLNDGMYGSFSQFISENRPIEPIPVKSYSSQLYNSSIWGPTLDSLDGISKNIFLPDMEINDFLVFENAGAYTSTAATNFNSFPASTYEYYLGKSDIYNLVPANMNITFNF